MIRKQTDARISKDGLLWHFNGVIDTARQSLACLEFQLEYSRDMDGTSHAQCVKAAVANMREHFDEIEAFMQEQAQ